MKVDIQKALNMLDVESKKLSDPAGMAFEEIKEFIRVVLAKRELQKAVTCENCGIDAPKKEIIKVDKYNICDMCMDGYSKDYIRFSIENFQNFVKWAVPRIEENKDSFDDDEDYEEDEEDEEEAS